MNLRNKTHSYKELVIANGQREVGRSKIGVWN